MSQTNRAINVAKTKEDCDKVSEFEWLPDKKLCVSKCYLPDYGAWDNYNDLPVCRHPAGSDVDETGARSDVNKPESQNTVTPGPGASIEQKADSISKQQDVFYSEPNSGFTIPSTIPTSSVLILVIGAGSAILLMTFLRR